MQAEVNRLRQEFLPPQLPPQYDMPPRDDRLYNHRCSSRVTLPGWQHIWARRIPKTMARISKRKFRSLYKMGPYEREMQRTAVKGCTHAECSSEMKETISLQALAGMKPEKTPTQSAAFQEFVIITRSPRKQVENEKKAQLHCHFFSKSAE